MALCLPSHHGTCLELSAPAELLGKPKVVHLNTATLCACLRETWPVCILGLVLRRSHSRPEETFSAQRAKMQDRPRQQFRSSTGRKKGDEHQYFLLSPSDTSDGRTNETSKLRRRIKSSTSAKMLLGTVESAMKLQQCDASVFGAAMQLCGQRWWWDALNIIYTWKEDYGVVFFAVQQSICLNALACCLRVNRNYIDRNQLTQRKKHAVRLGQTVFDERLPSTTLEFNCLLSASLKLCTLAGTQEAFDWATNLLDWSEGQPFQKTIVTYSTLLMVLEKQGKHDLVETILRELMAGHRDLKPNEVVLGGLLNCAAEKCDSKRADWLWDLLVCQAGVRPHNLAYEAFAKAQFSAGQPAKAVSTMEEIQPSKRDYRFAINYLQYCVVAFYVKAGCSQGRLRKALIDGRGLITKNTPAYASQLWRRLVSVAKLLLANPNALKLSDLLVTFNAKELSIMKDWKTWQEPA